jgi:anaerobic selenocysteine-containing dehydrogenase
VLSCINVTLATGQIGRPGAGYGTLTGQGNGQGGREHGQKSDMLPGGRDLGSVEELEADRPGAQAVDVFRFGSAEVRTGCAVVAPDGFTGPAPGGL